MSEEKKVDNRRSYQKKVKKKKGHGCLFYFIMMILILMVLGALAVGVLFGPKLARYYSEAKEAVDASTEQTFHMDEASYLYDSEGNVLAKLSSGGDSVYLIYDQIPEDVVNAFVAIEDNSFWTNWGFDLKGIVRVGVDFIMSKGQTKHGASTITQQLARNVFLSHEVSLERKAKELMYAYLLTKKYTKEQIMEFYVNDIYFANGYYGIEAAAKGYFNKKTSELTLSQIAYLCAIPNRPNYYDPYGDKDNAITRRNKILKDMKDRGDITFEEYSEAALEEIEVTKTSIEEKNYEVTFGIHCAVEVLMEENGFEFQYHFDSDSDYQAYQENYNETYEEMRGVLYTGGYQIYTSIDPAQQEILQRAVDQNLIDNLETSEEGIFAFQGAATVIDNSTGKVTAIVGGRKQTEVGSYSLNRAYQSYRQPGSTMKPIAVYTPALQTGEYTPETTLQEIDVSEAKNLTDTDSVKIGEMTGPEYTLREAVEQSKNGCAYQTFNNIGVKYGMEFIEKMHFAKIVPSDYSLSTALGGLTYGTTTLEMASAYSTLVNDGVYRGATCIVSMKNSYNEELAEEVSEQVYSKEASQAMVDVLTGVITNGTGRALEWSSEMEAMGKTGTTNDSKDGWFCGSTYYYTIAVWCGYDQPKTLDDLYGGSFPGHIWKTAMEELTKDLEAKDFDRPENAYEKYLPWMDENDILSDGYTVKDYREDYTLRDRVQDIADRMMYDLDPSDAQYESKVESLYDQGMNLVNQIYGNTAGNEAKSILNRAYSYAMSRAQEAEEEESSTEESKEEESSSKADDDNKKPTKAEKPAAEDKTPEQKEPEEPEPSVQEPEEQEPDHEEENNGGEDEGAHEDHEEEE